MLRLSHLFSLHNFPPMMEHWILHNSEIQIGEHQVGEHEVFYWQAPWLLVCYLVLDKGFGW